MQQFFSLFLNLGCYKLQIIPWQSARMTLTIRTALMTLCVSNFHNITRWRIHHANKRGQKHRQAAAAGDWFIMQYHRFLFPKHPPRHAASAAALSHCLIWIIMSIIQMQPRSLCNPPSGGDWRDVHKFPADWLAALSFAAARLLSNTQFRCSRSTIQTAHRVWRGQILCTHGGRTDGRVHDEMRDAAAGGDGEWAKLWQSTRRP